MATAPVTARKPAAAPAAAKKPATAATGKAANAPAANETHPAKPARRGRRGLLFVLLALVAAGAGGAWYYFEHAAEPAKAAAAPAAEPKKHPVFVPVDNFTVNLSAVSIDRYLQLGITLELANNSAADELKRQMPVIRSRMLMLLAAKTAEELATTVGKQKLMAELLAEARAPLSGDSLTRGVENVHFSAFVIQ